jgi:hypothetical protein
MIEDVANAKKWKLLMFRPVDENPSNKYLAYALVLNENKEYVSYLYNEESKGFYQGHYFTDLDNAVDDYIKRG